MHSCRMSGTRYVPTVDIRRHADEMKQRAPMLFARWLEEDRFLQLRRATDDLWDPVEMSNIAFAVPNLIE